MCTSEYSYIGICTTLAGFHPELSMGGRGGTSALGVGTLQEVRFIVKSIVVFCRLSCKSKTLLLGEYLRKLSAILAIH